MVSIQSQTDSGGFIVYLFVCGVTAKKIDPKLCGITSAKLSPADVV